MASAQPLLNRVFAASRTDTAEKFVRDLVWYGAIFTPSVLLLGIVREGYEAVPQDQWSITSSQRLFGWREWWLRDTIVTPYLAGEPGRPMTAQEFVPLLAERLGTIYCPWIARLDVGVSSMVAEGIGHAYVHFMQFDWYHRGALLEGVSLEVESLPRRSWEDPKRRSDYLEEAQQWLQGYTRARVVCPEALEETVDLPRMAGTIRWLSEILEDPGKTALWLSLPEGVVPYFWDR